MITRQILTVPHPVHEDTRTTYSYRVDSESIVVADKQMSYQLTPGQHFPSASHRAKHFTNIKSFIYHNDPMRLCHLHFTDEQTEAQKGKQLI